MNFVERVFAINELLHAGGHAISVNANPGVPDSAYDDVAPTIGTLALATDGSVSIFTADMLAIHASASEELPGSYMRWLHGRRVAAWVIDGIIQTIGAVGYPGKPVMMTPEMLERFQRRNPRANRYRPLN